MLGFIIVIHTIVCILLAGIILMQSGRGGGLTEAFASAESVFGAQTSSFLIKGTTILASLFLVTCLSLAFLSSKRAESIMANKGSVAPVKNFDITIPIGDEAQTPVVEAPEAVVPEAQVPEVPEVVIPQTNQ